MGYKYGPTPIYAPFNLKGFFSNETLLTKPYNPLTNRPRKPIDRYNRDSKARGEYPRARKVGSLLIIREALSTRRWVSRSSKELGSNP